MLKGLGDTTGSIAQAIAQMEGYNTPGTLAARNNNPGNLRSGPGQIGTSGGFAVFPDAATGWAALDNQINLNISRGLTLNQFFAGVPGGYPGYAPSADANNPAQYAAFVSSRTGIDPDVPLDQLSDFGTGGDGGCDPFNDPSCNDGTGIDGVDTGTLAMVGIAIAAAFLMGGNA